MKKSGPEIMYCASCQSRITSADLDAGRALRVAQRAACTGCLPSLMGSLTPAELKSLIVEGKAPAPAAPVAPARTPSTARLLPSAPPAWTSTAWWVGSLVATLLIGLGIWLLRAPRPVEAPAAVVVKAPAPPAPPLAIPSEGAAAPERPRVVEPAPVPVPVETPRLEAPQPPPFIPPPAAEPAPVEPSAVVVPEPPKETPKEKEDVVPPPAPVVAKPAPKPVAIPAKPVKGLDPLRVDAAIAKGLKYLQADPQSGEFYRDLVLYTMAHAGEGRGPWFQKLLDKSLEADLQTTYRVALQAMTLSELAPAAHQKRLAQCGQFLVDNQCVEGGWTYGRETTYPAYVATPAGKSTATPSRPSSKGKPPAAAPIAKPATLIRLKRQPLTPDRKPDNSNTQYAALGLRACLEANVIPPEETLRKMKAWWEAEILDSGAWGYSVANLGRNQKTTGSMSAGALGGLVIAKHYLREPWAADPKVLKGLQWLGQSFTVESNPGGEAFWHLYYLYAVERVGALTSVSRLGAHDWYAEGALKILTMQRPDGSWDSGDKKGWNLTPVADTCFAVLFLRRATRPLEDVASVDPIRR